MRRILKGTAGGGHLIADRNTVMILSFPAASLSSGGQAGRQAGSSSSMEYGVWTARASSAKSGWSWSEEWRGWQVGASAVSSLDATSPAVDGGSNPQAGLGRPDRGGTHRRTLGLFLFVKEKRDYQYLFQQTL